MPKNKGKGGKNRRRGKNENDDVKRELILKEDGQAYAQVMKMLGNGRLEALCFENNKQLLCHIRGKLRKKVWINTADIILIGLRDFQESKADVILKYTPDEARVLKNKGQIPEHVNITDTSQFGQDAAGDDIYFDELDNGNDSDDASDSIDDTLTINKNKSSSTNRQQQQKKLPDNDSEDDDDDDEDDDEEEEEEREQDEGDLDLYMSGYANNNRKSNYIGSNRQMKNKNQKYQDGNDDAIDRI